MAKVAPYHTNGEEYPPTHRNVYHDHDDCQYGKESKPEHRVDGEGDQPRCEACEKLARGARGPGHRIQTPSPRGSAARVLRHVSAWP
jgi:hypothetical protein